MLQSELTRLAFIETCMGVAEATGGMWGLVARYQA